MNPAPIFVHSLFRSGSTYIFNVFRRSTAGYWCYQEPCHEHLRYIADAPERLLDIDRQHGALLRHPVLDKPYFWEFYQVKDAIAPLFKKQFSYEWFFIGENNPSFKELASYLRCLIDSARARPMLQCCRTFGHVSALRKVFAGTHINLWRNPRDQWWSYKLGVSFDATVLLILNAIELPAVMASARTICDIPDIHDQDIEKEFAAAEGHCLPSSSSYFAFYALWVYAMLEVPKVADLSINIDSLSSWRSYQDTTLAELAELGIDGLDFSDCAIVQAKFGRKDITFFDNIEGQVHDLYLQHGYTKEELAALLDLRERHRPQSKHSVIALAADAERVRDVAMQKSDSLAKAQRVVDARGADLAAAAALAAAQRQDVACTKVALAARQQELAEASARSDALAAELVNVRAQIVAMADDLVEASARLDTQAVELASARQLSERLHEELGAAGSRLKESGLETRRWWSVADDTSRHLQAIYASRSWRLTAPLREINAWRKRLAGSTGIGLATLGSMPRRIVQQLLLAAWAHSRGRPERRARFVRLLAPFPRLYSRLRAFAFAHATVPAASTPSTMSPGAPPMRLEARNGVHWEDYPGSVRQIHLQLMRARAAAAVPPSKALPTQTPR